MPSTGSRRPGSRPRAPARTASPPASPPGKLPGAWSAAETRPLIFCRNGVPSANGTSTRSRGIDRNEAVVPTGSIEATIITSVLAWSSRPGPRSTPISRTLTRSSPRADGGEAAGAGEAVGASVPDGAAVGTGVSAVGGWVDAGSGEAVPPQAVTIIVSPSDHARTHPRLNRTPYLSRFSLDRDGMYQPERCLRDRIWWRWGRVELPVQNP